VNDFTSHLCPPVKRIAESSVRRLSLYLRFLEDLALRGQTMVSSEELASSGATTSAQVRKDLSLFGSFGTRGLGYSVSDLVGRLRKILGVGRDWRVIIVGAGKIGAALAQYHGFQQHGFHVVGIFDNAPERVGTELEGILVRDTAHFARDVRALRPNIGIMTVPAGAAQVVADALVGAGVRAILNFAPARVQVPPEVTVRHVNMASELEVLTFALVSDEAGAL
jgi:redox-sensing transcriptional repressor